MGDHLYDPGDLPPAETVPSELVPGLFAPTTNSPRPAGAWVVYGLDWNAYPISLWPDELSARRDADAKGYGYVVFWPWGDFDLSKWDKEAASQTGGPSS